LPIWILKSIIIRNNSITHYIIINLSHKIKFDPLTIAQSFEIQIIERYFIMAPNNKQLNLILQFSPEDLLGPSKQHTGNFPPLATFSEENHSQEQYGKEPTTEEKVDAYWSWSPEPTAEEKEQESYWDWSENPSVNILTSQHITRNLTKTANISSKNCLNIYSDAKENELSPCYWDEKVYSEDDRHDDKKSRQVLSVDHIINNLREAGAENLSHDLCSCTESDKYWSM